MLSRIALGTIGMAAFLAISPGLGAAEALPTNRGVGQRVSNFTLKDVTGQHVTLYGFRGKNAVVIAFLGTDCPVGNLYVPRLVELNKAYKDRGVVFLAINANAHETVEEVAAHAKEHGIDFPVLKDPVNLVADLTMAERTCEVLVIDGRAMLRYRGAIDDQYGQGTRKGEPTKNYLRDALDAVLAKTPVAVTSTPVVGCLLDRVAAKPVATVPANMPRVRPAARAIVEALKDQEKTAVDVGKVTYAAEVAPILQGRCQSCHRPGQVAPFSLLTYDDARKHSAMIREVVDERRMPPWHADPRYGHFRNERRLNAKERATLLAWVDQGTPLGDTAALPPPATFPEGWMIGTPDVVFEIPEPYTVAAQGVLDYVNVRVPTNFTEDKWVQAAEAQPGDRAIVHHILVFVDDHGKSGGRRSEGHLCGFAPGDMPSIYTAGTAKKIPAGSDLVFQIHYTPNGKVRTDRSRVGFILAKAPVEHQAHTRGIVQQRFVIPAGADNHEVKSEMTVSKPIHLLSFMPHMHLRGKSFEYKATFPDGRSEILLSVPAYDFGWQSAYMLAEPMALPKGTRIDCVAHFDNSTANPANPNPNQAVAWGDQTFQEMMIGYIDYVEDGPIAKDAPPRKPEAASPLSKAAGAIRALRILNSALKPSGDAR